MALLKFLKGNYSNLSTKAIAEGQILICGDTGEMFVDVAADKRVKIGDFVVVSDIAALEALDATAVPTSRLYYVENGNILARSNGTSWTQINKQKTLSELGGVAATTYATDKEALMKADSDNAKAIEDLDTYVGTFTHNTAKTVVEYIDAKTTGIASAGNVEAIEARVTTAEGDIDKLETSLATGGATATAIANAAAAAEAAQGAADKAQGDVNALKAAVGTVEEGSTVVGMIGAASREAADARELAGTKVASVTAGDKSVTVGGAATAPTVAVKLSAEAGNAIELAEDGLKVVIPAAAEYTIEKAAESGDYAAVYALKKDGVQVGASINIPKDMVVESGAVVENPEGQAAGTYIELKLQNVAAPLYINVGNLIEYVTSGSATGDMVVINVSDDHKVTATITDGTITLAKLATDVQTAIGKAHAHENADILDSIGANQITAWNSAEQNAKDYADGLAKNYDAAGSAAAAQTAAEAKAAELDAALKTALQKEIDDDVKVVADDLAAYKTANNAEVAKKANSADVYAKTETYTQEEVNNAIAAAVQAANSWGEF